MSNIVEAQVVSQRLRNMVTMNNNAASNAAWEDWVVEFNGLQMTRTASYGTALDIYLQLRKNPMTAEPHIRARARELADTIRHLANNDFTDRAMDVVDELALLRTSWRYAKGE
jgi:hypothetical protein